MQAGDFLSLGAPSLKVIRKENPRSNCVTFTVDTSTGLKEGKYEERTPKGKLVYACNYRADRLHGPSEAYYDDGTPMSTSFFVDGALHGESRHWYPTGAPKIFNNYEGGKLHGIQQSWHLNGNLWTEYTKIAGEFNGSYRVYESTGELYEQKTFRGGVLHGIATKKIDAETFEERRYSAGIPVNSKVKRVADATFDLDYIASLADI